MGDSRGNGGSRVGWGGWGGGEGTNGWEVGGEKGGGGKWKGRRLVYERVSCARGHGVVVVVIVLIDCCLLFVRCGESRLHHT